MNALPIWWPKLEINSVGSVCLGLKGENGLVRIPTKKGKLFFESDKERPFKITFKLYTDLWY